MSMPHTYTDTLAEATDTSLTLDGVQQTVDKWITTVGVRYFSPLTNMAVLTEEVGEVARIMARSYGDQSFKSGENADALADELADVLWVLAAIANQTGVNLDAAFRVNLAKKTARDATRHRDNPKLRDGIQAASDATTDCNTEN